MANDRHGRYYANPATARMMDKGEEADHAHTVEVERKEDGKFHTTTHRHTSREPEHREHASLEEVHGHLKHAFGVDETPQQEEGEDQEPDGGQEDGESSVLGQGSGDGDGDLY